MTKIITKRIYEDESASDGFRVLVDRLWPRGVSKLKANLDYWAKEIAPSTELRTWFAHQDSKDEEFAARYFKELDENPETTKFIEMIKDHQTVVLLFATKDITENNALVLQRYLQQKLS